MTSFLATTLTSLPPAPTRGKPLSGAAIGFMRFRSAARTKSVRASANPLIQNGADLRQGPLSILDRREFQCAWVLGAEDGIATCCGAPVMQGQSWCPEHRAIVFTEGGQP
ncbi:hypothetical protein [Xanthobacter sediminis]